MNRHDIDQLTDREREQFFRYARISNNRTNKRLMKTRQELEHKQKPELERNTDADSG